MAQYRFLQDHFIANRHYLAGEVASTKDVVGGSLPVGWIPSGQVDPLDSAAQSAFWNAGVQLLGLVRQQWTGIPVFGPLVYWRRVSNIPGQSPIYQLTGQGAALGPKTFYGGTLP